MENSADKIMEDTIADFERRIVAIQKVKQTQGRSAAVAQYVPSCRGNDNLYCLGAYTNSLGAAMSKNGVSPRESGLMQATAAEKGSYQADKWGSPQISCPGAANYFETHKNVDVKSCGKSLQDMPKGTTLGEMLIQGYKDGSIPKGSLVMVRSDGNTSGTGMHAAMFVGLNEKGEPLFSCANPERIRQPMPKWSNQVASAGKSRETDCYVINTKKALEAKVPETRQPQKTQTQAQEQEKGQQAHASVGRGGLSKGNSDKKAELGSVGRPIGSPSFSLGRKGNDNSAANGKQSQKRGRFTSGRVAEANARVGRGGLSKGNSDKRAKLGSVGRPIGFPSFSLGRKGNDNSAANEKQSQKRGRFTSGRVAEANARVGRGGLSKGNSDKRAKLGSVGRPIGSPSFSLGRKGNDNSAANGEQSQKRGRFTSGRVAEANARVGRGGLSKGNTDKKAKLGSVGRPIGFPSFSLGRKGNDNSAANGEQSQKRGRFTSGRVAEANARVGRGNLSKGAGVKKRAELGRAKFSPLSVDGVVNSLKDAAKNIADKLRETVSNIGGRREVRNEIRARAKYRCALKTTKQTRQKKAVLSKGNARTEVKKVNLMKTLKRNSVGPSIRTSDRQSVTQRMNTSPALKKAMLAARTR